MSDIKSAEDFGEYFMDFLENNTYISVKKKEFKEFAKQLETIKAENERLKKDLYNQRVHRKVNVEEISKLKAKNEALRAENKELFEEIHYRD